MTSQEIEHSFQLVPSFEDPRINQVEVRLGLQPETRNRLADLCSISQIEATHPIGFRSEDIVSLLDSITRGKFPTQSNKQGQNLFHKALGWFYLTPLYSHEFFDNNPEYRSDRGFSQLSLHLLAKINHRAYGNVAKINDFVHCVEPWLISDWRNQAVVVLRDYDTSERFQKVRPYLDQFTDHMILEAWCDEMYSELESKLLLVESGYPIERVFKEKALFHYICEWVKPKYSIILDEWVKPNYSTTGNFMTAHLLETTMDRQGVVVGFNQNIVGNRKFMTDAAGDRRVIHSAPEMAIHAPRGIYKPLDTIAFIQPMGNYEDQVLRRLGIWDQD